MKLVTGAVTPIMAAKVAGALGVPEGIVKKVMTLGGPVILASLLKRGSTAGGTDAIGAALSGLGKNPLDGLGKALEGSPSQISAAAQGGSDMPGSLLGVGASGGQQLGRKPFFPCKAASGGAYAAPDARVLTRAKPLSE